MSREDVLRNLSILARRDPRVALYALAYLATEERTEVLEQCLEGCQEFLKSLPELRDHLSVARERFGGPVNPR